MAGIMNRQQSILILILNLVLATGLSAQFIIPEKIERAHPRTMSINVDKADLLNQLKTNPEVAKSFENLRKNVAQYVNRHVTDPEWMVSRLQMYWNTHATDVFINAGVYSHAEGHAPVPTVRFTGARDYVIDHLTPALEDIKPYMDDERGLWVQHKTTKNWEWVAQSKTGRIIENINSNIMSLAYDAALIYWIEGDEKYAKFAADLFDTYMVGMSYRSEPIDITKGHHQEIVGLTSFQVIKEGVLRPLIGCYDYLHDYLLKTAPEKMQVYTVSFRKFAEIIIKNGVPFNNWNLFEAQFVTEIALILEDDSFYEDGKGCQYYLDRVLNKTEARQWSINKLLAYGYDLNTGIWNECPGYSLNMVRDFMELASRLQNTLNMDLLPHMPVIPKAVKVLPQYLFPNRYVVGFGDTHYGNLSTGAMRDMVVNARNFNRPDQEREFTAMANMLSADEGEDGRQRRRRSFRSLLDGDDEFEFDKSVPPTKLEDFATQTFYAPNVSWVVQRNGLDPKHGLMISQAGSLGNHMHSNGIAMELYGKGYVLAPEGGVGRSYFQSDYLEYYSQFPAHNTVAVDGISKYPEMKSDHAFSVNAMYPKSECKEGFYPDITFSDLYFLEPATNSDQNRVMSIIRTGETSGYYVDVFRSRKKEAGDKYHDYFYHNLGQELMLSDRNNQPLVLSSSDRLSSADGDLTAYDYITDKQSIKSDQAFKSTYTLSMKGEEQIKMNMWMEGEEDREIFKVKSPPSEAFRSRMVPTEISEAHLQTIVVRQNGEAWARPFVVVYEPSTTSEPSTIRSVESIERKDSPEGFVGLKIESLEDRVDIVLSSDSSVLSNVNDISFHGTYGVVTTAKKNTTLFLGAGSFLEKGGYGIKIIDANPSSATLVLKNDSLALTTDSPALISIPDTYKKGTVHMTFGSTEIKGKRHARDGKKIIEFEVPAVLYQYVALNYKRR